MKKIMIALVMGCLLLAGCEQTQNAKAMTIAPEKEQYTVETDGAVAQLKPVRTYVVDSQKFELDLRFDRENQSKDVWVVSFNFDAHNSTINRFEKGNPAPLSSIVLKDELISQYYADDTQELLYVTTNKTGQETINTIQVYNYNLELQRTIALDKPISDFLVYNQEIYATMTGTEDRFYFTKLSDSGEVLHEEELRKGTGNFLSRNGDIIYIGTSNKKAEENKIFAVHSKTFEKQVLELGLYMPGTLQVTQDAALVYGEIMTMTDGKLYALDKKNQTVGETTVQYGAELRNCAAALPYQGSTVLLFESRLNSSDPGSDNTIDLCVLNDGKLQHVASYDLQGNAAQGRAEHTYIDGDNLVIQSHENTSMHEYEIPLQPLIK